MPAMTGLELHSQMLARGMRFPVIFITAHEDQYAEVRAAELGAVGFLYNPLRSKTLWVVIGKALERPPGA